MNRKKKVERRLSSKRDFAILCFLWKWKASTTLAIAERFYSHCHAQNAYYRLKKLWEAGYIEGRVQPLGNKFAWTLGKKGFESIQPFLPPLRSESYRSEHLGHDLLCSAVHICDFLKREKKDITLISEQELRAYDLEVYPKEIPVDSAHRSDGYWFISEDGKKKVISLEVELNPKSSSEYFQTGFFYSTTKIIHHVLWIVPNLTLANYIRNIFENTEMEKRNIHSFVLVCDFLSEGWSAKISLGQSKGKPMRELIHKLTSENPVLPKVYKPYTHSIHVYPQLLLTLSKSHKITGTSKLYSVGDFS